MICLREKWGKILKLSFFGLSLLPNPTETLATLRRLEAKVILALETKFKPGFLLGKSQTIGDATFLPIFPDFADISVIRIGPSQIAITR